MITNQSARRIRKDFPIFKDKYLVYLDNASSSQKPKCVIDAVSRFYETGYSNVHRGLYKLSENATLQYEDARRRVASFIGASEKEIIFTRGTTESINLLAYAVKSLISRGRDEIVVSELEHHSNLVPWQQMAKREGMKLRLLPFNNGRLDHEGVIGKKTALVSLVHISNALGVKLNVESIIAIAKKSGALTVIDAAQSAPKIPVDIWKLGCDFLAFSSHKMLGPSGVGVLFGKEELLQRMSPFNYGGDMIRSVTYRDAEWNDVPMKFEAGTPNIEGAIGLAAAIDYLNKIGIDDVSRWEDELLSLAVSGLKKLDVNMYYPGSGILSFNVPGIHPHDLAAILDEEGVCIRGGHHCAMPLMSKLGVSGTARASFYVYNTHEDIDRLIKAVAKAKRIFR